MAKRLKLTVRAHAKVNLDLRVLGVRADGYHELRTVFQTIELHDTLVCSEKPGPFTLKCRNPGVPLDAGNLVWRAAAALWTALGRTGEIRDAVVQIDKKIPVEAGLGGGSSDAAAALRLANESLAEPVDGARLHELASALGADVPLFLTDGPQLGQRDGTALSPLKLPRDYTVLVVLPNGATKHSTKAVYDAFDDRNGDAGFAERRDKLIGLLRQAPRLDDFAAWPRNDLAHSPLSRELERLGAVRADVSGAGPALYGLFEREAQARKAAKALESTARSWVAFPAWYG